MIFNEDIALLLPALILLAEFFVLAFLGFLFVQVLNWESAFRAHKVQWHVQMQAGAYRLRRLRQQLDKTGGEWPQLPISYGLRRKWMVARWIGRALSASQWARP